MAQQTSVIISALSFAIKHLAKAGMHGTTCSIGGEGLPRQRLLKVQLVFLTKELPGSLFLSNNSAIIIAAPEVSTMSRTAGPSPDMLPSPQITYSMIS